MSKDSCALIAVASGKGGVGKSTLSVNLAVTLASSGAKVGLLDGDIYGPNIPQMMGIHKTLEQNETGRIQPLVSHGVRLVSVGFITGDSDAVIYRGPLVGKMIKKYLNDVDWGGLDYLLVDLPPGTGDASLTLAQAASLTGAVVVTTPQQVALSDVRKCITMFKRLKVPILGIVENMSFFVSPQSGERTEIFGHGGGKAAAGELAAPGGGPKTQQQLTAENKKLRRENAILREEREILKKAAAWFAAETGSVPKTGSRS